MLIERQVDGVLLVPARSSGESFRLLHMHGVPTVAIDRRSPPQRRQRALRLGGRRLRAGRAPGWAGPPADRGPDGPAPISTSIDRVAGAHRALEVAGLTLDEDLVHYGGFTFGKSNQADGHRMAIEMLAAPGDRPTAVFCANNFIAFGAIRALREADLRVPDDISVVAFDDLPEEWVAEPFLTVAAQPAYDIGNRAATRLLDHIAGAHQPTGESIVLPFDLIIRRSAARRASSSRELPHDRSDPLPRRAR